MIKLTQNQPGIISLEIRGAQGELADGEDEVDVVVTDGVGDIVATELATHVSVGLYELELTGAQTAALDEYDAEWRVKLNSVWIPFVTHFEIAGGHYFTVQEAMEFDKRQLDDVEKYPHDLILRMREEIEEDLEEACGVAFVRRGKRETLLNAYDDLILSRRAVRTLYSASLGGTALTVDEIDVKPEGALERDAGFDGAVTVYYEHGYEQPPAPIKRAALVLLISRLVPSNIDKRVLSHTDEGGTRQYAVPNKDHPFGIPEVDAAVERFSDDDLGIG